MATKDKEGTCLLCGQFGKLTFEHVPPQSAFNDKPIWVQNHQHLTEKSNPVFGKRMRSNPGFGAYTLCVSCNNNTGAWYGKEFCEFVRQGMAFLNEPKIPGYVEGLYKIKPLNVFKQIMIMFMSADKSGYLQSKSALVDFLLNKGSNALPNDFKIYIYSNASIKKRMLGYSVAYTENLGIQKWSEISFQPFGYLLTDKSLPAHEDMVDITPFSKIPYSEEREIGMVTRYLKVSSPWIGSYD